MAKATSSSNQSRGHRVRAELEEAISEAAGQLADAVSRWYGPQHASLRRLGTTCDCQADMKVGQWLECAPAGCRGLLILVDGLKYLTYEAPRAFLKRLLTKYEGLHVLVTVTAPPRSSAGATSPASPTSLLLHADKFDNLEAKAVAAAMKGPPLPLDPQIGEYPKMVPLPPLSPMEIADIFLIAMMRGQQGRPLGQLLSGMMASMGRDQVLGVLCRHAVVESCRGLPGRAIWEATNVDPSVKTLEDLRPSLAP